MTNFDLQQLNLVIVAAVLEAIIFLAQAYLVRQTWRVDERPRRTIGWLTFLFFLSVLTVYFGITAFYLLLFAGLTCVTGWIATGIVEYAMAEQERANRSVRRKSIYDKIKEF